MSAPQQYGPPDPSRGSGNSFLVIVGIIVELFVLGCGGVCAGLFLVGRATTQVVQKEAEEIFRQVNEDRAALEQQLTPAMVNSIMAAEIHPAVIEQVGAPQKPGNYHKTPRYGELDPADEVIEFDVSGPK